MRPALASQRCLVRLSSEEWTGKEGLRADGRFYPYRDYEGFWTIGVGHLVKQGEDFSRGLTAAQVIELYHHDLRHVYDAIPKGVYAYGYDQSAFDSMVLTGHNCGVGFFVPSECTAVRLLNVNDVEGYRTHLLDWNKSGKPPVFDKGLYARRQREAAWFVEAPPPPDVAPEVLFSEWEKFQVLAGVDWSAWNLVGDVLEDERAEDKARRDREAGF